MKEEVWKRKTSNAQRPTSNAEEKLRVTTNGHEFTRMFETVSI
jgi:hypothetical protein